MSEELFTVADVSKKLNVRPHRVAYLFMTRKLAEPRLRLGGRRVFTNGDAKRVAKALGLTWETDQAKETGNEQQQ